MEQDVLQHDDVLHPRPQLTRERWVDLCGTWDFAHDDEDRGRDDGWYEPTAEARAHFDRAIIVPFPPESPASGVGDAAYHPIVWYRRTFTLDASSYRPGERLLLHCGAVDYRARAWVNGQLVVTHEGGHTPFSADITAALRPSGEQVVVIRAEDMPLDLAQPRGKQDWLEQPHSIWYNRTTGIWQPVWLEPVPPTHVARLRWTPDLDRGLLGFKVTLSREDERPLRLRVRLSLREQDLSDDLYTIHGTEILREAALDGLTMGRDEVLWSPRFPNLIDARLTLLAGDEVIDEVRSYAGLRSAGVSAGRFVLNGRPYYLRLALEQGYWPESHLAAPSVEAMRREVELVRELGFNGVRIHQKVEDPRFLYWCDRLGLLVWGEMANAYVFSPLAVERLTREWLEVLERDYSHPCIVAWVPLNESWGVPNLQGDAAQRHYVQGLYHLTKTLDPTRLAIGNDGWEHLVGDIFGVHDYAVDSVTLRERYGSIDAVERTLREVQPHHRAVTLLGYRREGEPIMITEFGGISYDPEAGKLWFGYGTVKTRDEYLDKYRELLDAILDSPAVAGFCYTQLTDTGQEVNGLLTERREPKLDPEAIYAITRRASAAVPGDVLTQIQERRGVTSFASASIQVHSGG